MKKLVVFTGAGISAESGLKTFRDADGLWEGYNIEDVATPEAWKRDPKLVQQFYNERREQILNAAPNEAHKIVASLDEFFDLTIITQNIDDLHERAGSKNVVHLHGIITRSQSSADPKLTYPIVGSKIEMGALCELGSQLRPHVVWFGEEVPMIEKASVLCSQADIFILVGSSLAVYPAAGLLEFVPSDAVKYIIDPKIPSISAYQHVVKVEEKAVAGIASVKKLLLHGL
ncbi:NAD-dependent deacetylase [Pedobacter sp. UYEF25]